MFNPLISPTYQTINYLKSSYQNVFRKQPIVKPPITLHIKLNWIHLTNLYIPPNYHVRHNQFRKMPYQHICDDDDDNNITINCESTNRVHRLHPSNLSMPTNSINWLWKMQIFCFKWKIWVKLSDPPNDYPINQTVLKGIDVFKHYKFSTNVCTDNKFKETCCIAVWSKVATDFVCIN